MHLAEVARRRPVDMVRLTQFVAELALLEDAQALIVEHTEFWAGPNETLFPRYHDSIQERKDPDYVMPRSTTNFVLMAIRRFVVTGWSSIVLCLHRDLEDRVALGPGSGSDSFAIRQYDRLCATRDQVRGMLVTAARQVVKMLARLPSLPHATHSASIALDDWAQVFLDVWPVTASPLQEGATALES